MDEDDVLVAVYKIHHRLGGVAEKKVKHDLEDQKKKKIQTSPAFDFVIQTNKRETITLCSKQMKI